MKERCRETLERAYLYVDGEGLSEAERLEIQTHLEDCAPCFERVGLDHEVSRVIARLKGHDQCPEGLKARITALIVETHTRYEA
ncbi:MAG: mycothiol system anti-sigma-R factor [Actinomycetota bacterium]